MLSKFLVIVNQTFYSINGLDSSCSTLHAQDILYLSIFTRLIYFYFACLFFTLNQRMWLCSTIRLWAWNHKCQGFKCFNLGLVVLTTCFGLGEKNGIIDGKGNTTGEYWYEISPKHGKQNKNYLPMDWINC